MKKFYFLSGLPRSGSTLLSAILNQNPEIYSSPTSGLIEIMGATLRSWYAKVNEVQGRDDDELFRLLKAVMESKYENINKPIIIDKSRGWSNSDIMRTMSKLLDEPIKIIATVRNVPDCAASFVRVAKPNDVEKFLRESSLIEHLKTSYITLSDGFSIYPESIHFVDYDDLLSNPKNEMNKIHKFLNLKDFEYNFDNIDGTIVKENDKDVWKLPNLHDIKPKLERQHNQDSKDILGIMYESFNQDTFWKKEKKKKKKTLLNEQFELSIKGDIDKSWELLQILEKREPKNNRVAFNKGWFLINQGKLLEGFRYLERGRIENFFGNFKQNKNVPLWDGKSKETVLLFLEGGFGDQIHAIRYAKDIEDRGCKVIVACSNELIPILHNVDGVTSIVQKRVIDGVYYDSYVPSMSAILNLGYEFSDIKGIPYIKKPEKIKNQKIRIGLRWEGNQKFEHEIYRKFPANLLFDSVKDFDDVEFVSLQKDSAIEITPNWVEKISLETWSDTLNEISKCDLVISSCTSVAHLSAAVGIPTWIVIPILPYYLWALPGEKSPFYDSVRLFRQETFGNWAEPFIKIEKELEKFIQNFELDNKKIETISN